MKDSKKSKLTKHEDELIEDIQSSCGSGGIKPAGFRKPRLNANWSRQDTTRSMELCRAEREYREYLRKRGF